MLEVKSGTRVRLFWNGYRGVPKWLHLTLATVVRTTRFGGVVVKPDLECGERTVRFNQVTVKGP